MFSTAFTHADSWAVTFIIFQSLRAKNHKSFPVGTLSVLLYFHMVGIKDDKQF